MAKKIALVDDEKNILLVEKALLQSKGYEVIAINGSLVADEVIKEHMPDLVLMDLIMPGRNGVELAYNLKTDPATKDIKIIAVTGEPILNDQNMHNFDDMVLKPFKSEELIGKISTLIG
jgi:CheY-like chemotaxis protein